METYIELLPYELTLIILDFNTNEDKRAVLSILNENVSKEYMQQYYNLFLDDNLSYKKFSNYYFSFLIIKYKEKYDDFNIKKDVYKRTGQYSTSDDFVSLKYFEENGDYTMRTADYIKNNVESEYFDILFKCTNDFDTPDLHISKFINRLFDNKYDTYYQFIALEKLAHHIRYLSYMVNGPSSRNTTNIKWGQYLKLGNFTNDYIYMIGSFDTIFCEEHTNSECDREYGNCNKCLLKRIFPKLTFRKLKDYELEHIPVLFTFSYYMDSIVNGFDRDNNTEKKLIDKMIREYELSESYLYELINNKDQLKHLFPNEERVEFIPYNEVDYM